MANNEFTIPIPARLKNVAKGGHVAGAEDIIDDALGKEQSEINQNRIDDIAEVKGGSTKSIADLSEDIAAETERATTIEVGLRESIDELGQIGLDPDNAISTNGDDFEGDTIAKRSKIPTIGAIIDGNPGVYDVSKGHPTGGPNSDGKFTLEYILANANTLIPTSRRHGGMEICFVQSSDNNYIQARLMANAFTTDVTKWQVVDDKPTVGSKNLVESGGVANAFDNVQKQIDGSNNYTEGGYINSDGLTIIQNPAYSYSNFIDVVAEEKIRFYVGTISDNLYLCFYDSQNQLVEWFTILSRTNKSITKVVPVNSVKARFSFEKDFHAYCVKLEDNVETEVLWSVAHDTLGTKDLINNIEKEISGNIQVSEYFQGNISNGKFHATTIRAINRTPINIGNDLQIICSGYAAISSVAYFKEGKTPEIGGIENTDWKETSVSGSKQDYVSEYDSDFPNRYITFKNASDASADITAEYVSSHVKFIDFGCIDKQLKDIKEEISEINEKIPEEDVLIIKTALGIPKIIELDISGNMNPSQNLFPLVIPKGSVFNVKVETQHITAVNGLYFKDSLGTDSVKKYDVTNGNTYTFNAEYNIVGLSIYFSSDNFESGYSSGHLKLSILIDNAKKYIEIPTTTKLQSFGVNVAKGTDLKLKVNVDVAKVTKVSGIYLYNGTTEVTHTYNVPLNEYLVFENISENIDKIEIYTVNTFVTEATSAVIDVIYGENVVSDIAYENKNIISAVADKRDVVPDYYFADGYLDVKVKRINKLAQESDDTFVFTTDEHWEFNAQVTPAIIKYLERYCNFSKMISTGDHVQMINEYEKAELSRYCLDYMHMLGQINKPMYSSVGNHEYLTSKYPEGLFDNVNLNNWVKYTYYLHHYKDVVIGDNTWMYFYLDDELKKLRYVFLNSFEKYKEETIGDKKGTVAEAFISNAQLSWLENVALNVESGYGVIVVVHSIVGVNYSNQSTNDQTIYISQSADRGYKSCANVILKYTGNADFIVMFSGHTHRDGIDMVDDVLAQNTGVEITNNAFFNLCTTCDTFAFPPSMTTETIPHRHRGTINECAFDVCMINRAKHRIDMVRIGDKANLIYNFSGNLEERAVVYQIQNVAVGGTKSLENDIEGTASWSSSNTAVATVNGGIVTGISVGFAKISVEDTTNHRAIVYIVKVN